MKKRILALLLALFMLATLFPAALAEGPAEAAESPAEEPAEAADVPEEAPAEEEAPEPEEESADEPAAETCKVDIYIQPGLEAGTARVVESSPYYVGQTITLKAEANSGYTFMWWINYETEEFSYSSTYQTTLTGDCEWDAVFKKSGEYFIYISKPYDEEGDNTLQVSPDQHSYPKDTEITLTAPAVPGRSIVYEYGKDVDGESASVDWIRIPNGGNKFKMPAYDTWVRGLYSHTITLNVGANGTASLNPASGPYYEGDVVTLTVNPNSGYRLKNISGVPSNYTSSGNTVTFTMEDFDVTLDVEFEEIPTTTYTIKAYPYPSGSGTVHMDVNGAGQVTLTATPLDGYHFYGWLDSNSNILSTDNPYSFTATKDITIYGFFYVQVIVYPNIEHGKVEVENYKTIYAKGDVITLIGTPDDGYVLDYFLAGELHGTSATLTKLNGNSFTMPANDMVVAAKFAKLHTITATANPTAGGTVTGAGSYKDGATVSLTATPKSGYDFVSWTENGSVVSTSATYSFTATADRNLVANFQANTVTKYTISATANPTAGGSVSGAGEYEAGKTVTLTATPNSGYNFVNWTENGTEVSTSAAYSFTASANRTLVANFELKPVTKYTISASANPAEGGSVSGAGEYEEGKTVTLTATPNEGYSFVKWTENGTAVSTDATYSFTASADRTLVAIFMNSSAVWSSPLWVGGVQVTSENAEDILGDGTAKYEGNGTAGTLTLTNANITGNYSGANIYVNRTAMTLTISLVGENTLSGSSDGIRFWEWGDLFITGSGSLTTSGDSDGIDLEGYLTISGCTVNTTGGYNGINGFGNVTLVGCTVNATGYYYGIAPYGDVTIVDSFVTVTATGSSSYGLWCMPNPLEGHQSDDGYIYIRGNSHVDLTGSIAMTSEKGIFIDSSLTILEPEGAWVKDGTVVDASGNWARHVVIGRDLSKIPYVDAQGNDKEPVTQYTVVSADNRSWSTGWYVVTEDTRIDGRIGVSGDVHLILCDGATLTAVQGITVTGANALTIWQQSGGTGALVINDVPFSFAGIGGGGQDQNGGTITINGGNITTTNGNGGAGIGGGTYGAGGTITINGGAVTVDSSKGSGAGIGGGYCGQGGSITINGGTVRATGGTYGAGIGGDGYYGGTITITGGTVTATGGANGAGIGGSDNTNAATIIITGGTVIATGTKGGAGIGGSNASEAGADVTISGGTVTATGGGGGAWAIGCGKNGSNPGSLTISGGLMVAAGSNADSAKKVLAVKRASACQENAYARIEPCTHPNGPDNCVWCDEDAELPLVYGKTLALQGKIALNVYLILPETVTADPDAYVTFGEEKTLVSAARTVVQGDQTFHVFTVSVKFAQLTEKYPLHLYSGADELLPLFDSELRDYTESGYICCAQDYIEQVLAESDDEKLVALVTALSDVGSLSQLQFNYNVGERSELLGDLSAITADSVSAYAPVISSKAGTGISYYGSSLLLTDDTTIRHYFIVKGDLSQFTFKVDGKTVQPVKKGSYYYIDIVGIVARDLNRTYHVEVSSSAFGVIISLDYSALSYVWKNFSKGDGDDTLRSLLRALTLYSQAADAYFGS